MAIDLKTYFSRCVVVNLDRRQDRWEHIQKNVIPRWPFAPLERFQAVDGQLAFPPAWWRAGPGAWGVYRGHSRLLEGALVNKLPNILILEDDAVLCDDFERKVTAFLEAVPKGWGMLYLGGQHLDMAAHPPKKINDLVYRAWNVNRLHAFAVAKPHMGTVYKWLNKKEWLSHRGEKGQPLQDHIDHHLGRLHMQQSVPIYTPHTWLVGQLEGQSNICGQTLERRFWKGADMKDGQQVIAVVGTYRGGTSCVAGMLHKLGCSMGQKFFQGREVDTAKGCFEALPLYQLCMRAYGEPHFKMRNNFQDRVRELRQWVAGRWNHGPVIGAKHPKFCLMVPEIMAAWPGVKLVVVNRPLEEATASLHKAGWWLAGDAQTGPAWSEALLRRFLDKRNKDLEKVPEDCILRLEFPDVIRDPAAALEKFLHFINPNAHLNGSRTSSGYLPPPPEFWPTKQQVAAAIEHADSKLYRNRLAPCETGSRGAEPDERQEQPTSHPQECTVGQPDERQDQPQEVAA